MKTKPLSPKDVGLPLFSFRADQKHSKTKPITLFNLSSHARANEAVTFGLQMRNKGFHVFVIGEDHSGRMTSTMVYLNQYIQKLPTPSDWVYLNNFTSPHRPQPFQLPHGKGFQLKQALSELISSFHVILSKTFSHPHYMSQIDSMTTSLEAQVQQELQTVQEFAKSKGLIIEESNEGFSIQVRNDDESSDQKPSYSQKDIQDIKDQLNRITTSAHLASRQLSLQIKEAKKTIAQQVMAPLLSRFKQNYEVYLEQWIQEFTEDVLEHIEEFLTEDSEAPSKLSSVLEERYAVNLLINNKDKRHPEVILESTPTYENLFGSIKYRTTQAGGIETNFTMIRPGSLHRANGGILVLRAEALAQSPEVWDFLKAALRDQRIRIHEQHRDGSLPLLDAPEPISIPLDVQVFLIGAPSWYYSVFFQDPEFRTYFKIKAEIDPDLPTTSENLSTYAHLIQQSCFDHTGLKIEKEAIQYLMGYSARWVGHRQKLNAKFELVADVLDEAGAIAASGKACHSITLDDIKTVINNRRKRVSQLEDRSHEDIESGQIFIDTTGHVIGQVNGLTVLNTGDHQYGLPSRISARTYAGELGIINIERLTEMSGPIQQKGALILDGYLSGMFAQDHPLSCGCSITFEQNYGGVEGDSASLAELIAILSSLSQTPLRQDIAVTGSINQLGDVQPVGGVIHKIEGFYRTCQHKGLTKTQGVIIPKTNVDNVVLRDEIAQSAALGEFTIWPVSRIEEALEILTGVPHQTIFKAVSEKLSYYNQSLKKLK